MCGVGVSVSVSVWGIVDGNSVDGAVGRSHEIRYGNDCSIVGGGGGND